MTALFLDTSAFLKYFAQEPGTEIVRSLMARSKRICLSRLAYVEVHSALWRKREDKSLSKPAHKRVLRAFKRMWSAKFPARSPAMSIDLKVPVDEDVLTRAAELSGFLIERGCRLRTLDLIQLASAERVANRIPKRKGDEMLFVVADRRLAQSAGVLEQTTKSLRVVWIDPVGHIRPAIEAGFPQQSSPRGGQPF